MASNELTVKTAGGVTETLRSEEVEGSSQVHAEVMFADAAPEAVVSLTGGTIRHTVGTSTVVTLDPPNAAARYARLRVREATGSSVNPLYYRQDGTAPTNDGANATGFLLHGDPFVVRIRDATQFRMIAGAGSFEVHVEWLNLPSS